MQDKRRR